MGQSMTVVGDSPPGTVAPNRASRPARRRLPIFVRATTATAACMRLVGGAFYAGRVGEQGYWDPDAGIDRSAGPSSSGRYQLFDARPNWGRGSVALVRKRREPQEAATIEGQVRHSPLSEGRRPMGAGRPFTSKAPALRQRPVPSGGTCPSRAGSLSKASRAATRARRLLQICRRRLERSG